MFLRRLPYIFATGCFLYKSIIHNSIAFTSNKGEKIAGNRPTRVVIVGGGIIGLSVAHGLITENPGDVSLKLIDAGIPIYSSVGETRYTELVQRNQFYLDMALESHKKWRQLENQSSNRLFYEIPLLEVRENSTWSHYIQLLTSNNIKYEILNSDEISERFPTLRFDSASNSHTGFLSIAGIIHAENVMDTLRSICTSSANFQYLRNKSVVRIDVRRHVAVDQEGVEHEYDKLALCAGPWTNRVLKSSSLTTFPLLVVSGRRSYFGLLDNLPNPEWFNIDSGKVPSLRIIQQSSIGEFNCFSLSPHIPGGEAGCKCGIPGIPEIIGNEEFRLEEPWRRRMLTQFKDYKFIEKFELCPNPSEPEHSISQALIGAHILGIDADKMLKHIRCIYTVTPDGYSIIGSHPDDSDIIVACGFNCEGFHVSPVVGQMVAKQVLGSQLSELEQRMSDSCNPERSYTYTTDA